jgi:hypothetical protein
MLATHSHLLVLQRRMRRGRGARKLKLCIFNLQQSALLPARSRTSISPKRRDSTFKSFADEKKKQPPASSNPSHSKLYSAFA